MGEEVVQGITNLIGRFGNARPERSRRCEIIDRSEVTLNLMTTSSNSPSGVD
jgi:hypothetical protein